MAEVNLPFFKFYPDKWQNGKVSDMSFAVQGFFLNVCNLYWKRFGDVTVESIKARLSQAEATLKPCLDSGIIEINTDGKITIKFLDEQLEELRKKREKFSESGRKGVKIRELKKRSQAKATHDARLKPPLSILEEEIEEDKEEDIKKKENTKRKNFPEQFEIARKLFPGTKRGKETEYENFKKKHKDWESVIPLLQPAIQKQINYRRSVPAGAFVPQWKNFQTWINQRCWEEEPGIVVQPQLFEEEPKPQAHNKWKEMY